MTQDFSGFDAVAVDAGRLSHPGHIQLSHAMKEADAAALTGSIQEAGAKALFYVTGSASALKGDAAETAAILKEAVEDGGYDGLFLDLPRLGDASKSDLTALVRALREALGERLLYVMAEAPHGRAPLTADMTMPLWAPPQTGWYCGSPLIRRNPTAFPSRLWTRRKRSIMRWAN